MKAIILRGIPGCGKSTYAKKYLNAKIVSADHHFIKGGEYKFDPLLIGDAHNGCLRLYLRELQRNVCNVLIVDNTNIHAWEIAPYYQMAQAYGVEVSIVSLNCDLETALSRNIHNAPERTIIRMLDDYSSERFPTHWMMKIVPFRKG